MAKKIRIGVIFGGQSVEHEISLLSAKNVIAALDKRKYTIIPIGIAKNGGFFVFDDIKEYIVNDNDPRSIALSKKGIRVFFPLGKSKELVGLTNKNFRVKIDVAFPILHGTLGEDGTVQGLLKLANIPFVGVGVLGSAVGFDKDVAKRLLHEAGITVADFLTFNAADKARIDFKKISNEIGLPFFIKPANAGSSVGVSKVKNKRGFFKKVMGAFCYDNKVIFERAIQGKEIECSVLGNEKPIASLPGRIIPRYEFYSYDAKYIDENGASFEIPASLSPVIIKTIQNIAIRTYKVLGCEGMARVDGFLTKEGNFVVNEINTIPGFTSISMYPKLWEVSGVGNSELLDRLIKLAFGRFNRDKKIKTTH